TITPTGDYDYTWSNGDKTEDLTNQVPGSYSLTVSDANGCTVTATFNIAGSTSTEVIIGAELNAQGSGLYTITLSMNKPLSAIKQIDWSPLNIMSCQSNLCTEQNISINEDTEIRVMVTDTNGCMGSARLILEIDKDIHIYIPNVFSPNGDGANDQFTIFTNEEVKEIVELEIFDRWGNNVFIKENFPPNEPMLGWDGTFKEQEMNPAVFAYIAVIRDSNDQLHRYKGDVTLVR
ncbi:MAG TPA: gliding motility-associated C-terminal domain-containing protein, partial [Saprospiraceae bacterium]|nr:gliding motility-associated C-terminal domain-containing protein [Saprospiraceae bacterium]